MAYDNNYGDTHSEPDLSATVNITGETVAADLYAGQAQLAAETCNKGKDGPNASSQLRRFYDELVMWHEKVFDNPDTKKREAVFQESLPYIQMLRAKVAYGRGRSLVDDNFYQLFDGLITQVQSPETLKRARLFMEALLGFKKYLESNNGYAE